MGQVKKKLSVLVSFGYQLATTYNQMEGES